LSDEAKKLAESLEELLETASGTTQLIVKAKANKKFSVDVVNKVINGYRPKLEPSVEPLRGTLTEIASFLEKQEVDYHLSAADREEVEEIIQAVELRLEIGELDEASAEREAAEHRERLANADEPPGTKVLYEALRSSRETLGVLDDVLDAGLSDMAAHEPGAFTPREAPELPPEEPDPDLLTPPSTAAPEVAPVPVAPAAPIAPPVMAPPAPVVAPPVPVIAPPVPPAAPEFSPNVPPPPAPLVVPPPEIQPPARESTDGLEFDVELDLGFEEGGSATRPNPAIEDLGGAQIETLEPPQFQSGSQPAVIPPAQPPIMAPPPPAPGEEDEEAGSTVAMPSLSQLLGQLGDGNDLGALAHQAPGASGLSPHESSSNVPPVHPTTEFDSLRELANQNPVQPAPAGGPLPARVILRQNDGTEEIYPFTGDVLSIGRGRNNDIQIRNDAKISRYHCRIYRQQGAFVIEDNRSSNGTLVNGEPIDSRQITGGEQIMIGETPVLFQVG
jgi:hypothetical protein